MTASESRLARLLREMRVSFVLALPLVLSQLSSMAMNIVDTVLAGRHGPVTLAAVGVGSAVWSVVILVSIGVLMAVPPTVSQLNGAGRRADIGPVFRQALWLALALGLLLIFVVRAGAVALEPLGITAEARPEAVAFLHAISWGAPGLALFFCLRNLSEGVAWTLPSMVFGLVGLTLLVPLGWGLMFGAGLGAAGLGYAVAIVLWCQAASMAVYLWRRRASPTSACSHASIRRAGPPSVPCSGWACPWACRCSWRAACSSPPRCWWAPWAPPRWPRTRSPS